MSETFTKTTLLLPEVVILSPKDQQENVKKESLSKKESVVSLHNKNLPKTKCMKFTKIIVPHVLLNIALFAYLIFGAYLFRWLEQQEDNHFQQRKAQRILESYRNISLVIQTSCPRVLTQQPNWRQNVRIA
jgi:hypothetical protein